MKSKLLCLATTAMLYMRMKNREFPLRHCNVVRHQQNKQIYSSNWMGLSSFGSCSGFESRQGQGISLFSKIRDLPWHPHSLLFSGNRDPFAVWSGRGREADRLHLGLNKNEWKFFFYRGHPVVLILTNNIQYFSSDTTRLYIHKNVITGLLVSVSQNHLSGPQY